jgi:hypothetical protein
MPCQGCLSMWMDLDSIPETALVFGLTMLDTPMTLHMNLFIERMVMTYDEDTSMEATLDCFRGLGNLLSDLPTCPTHVLGWILHAWYRFIRNCNCTMPQSLSAMFPSQSLLSLAESRSSTLCTERASSSPPAEVDYANQPPTNGNMDLDQNGILELVDEYIMGETMENVNPLLTRDNDDVDDADGNNINTNIHNVDNLSEAEITRQFLGQQICGILQDADASELSDSEDEDIE